jgi:hypothetical protein
MPIIQLAAGRDDGHEGVVLLAEHLAESVGGSWWPGSYITEPESS